jgi:hypothetical protein
LDKQAHHCDVQNVPQGLNTEIVDQAVIGGRKMFLPGEVSGAQAAEKSAETIVATGTEPRIETVEAS